MAITWKINDMKRDTATGGVNTVYWECRVVDDTHSDCTAVEATGTPWDIAAE